MHFMGMNGMTRRIPDYPDVYFAWNYISSVGSLVSICGLLIFFCILFDLLKNNINLFFQIGGRNYAIEIGLVNFIYLKNLIFLKYLLGVLIYIYF